MCKNKSTKKSSWAKDHLIAPVVCSIISSLVVFLIIYFWISPPQIPNINPAFLYNTGTVPQYSGTFKMKREQDSEPWLQVVLINNGNGSDENLEIELLLNDNKFMDVQPNYIPDLLRRKVVKSEMDSNRFYENLYCLPSDAGIEYKFKLEKFLKSSSEFNHSILSDKNNWSKKTTIEPKLMFPKISVISDAYAAAKPTEDKIINDLKRATNFKSGVLIGGYDPLVMSNGIFILLQSKSLISNNDAQRIIKQLESYKKGVLLGGINILKFNDLILNTLLSNGLITVDEAEEIINKSKNAGGILFGDYNIIAMQVGMLNALLKDKKISLSEGQFIIDMAGSISEKNQK